MYKRFHKLPLWGQVVVTMLVLLIAWTLLQLVIGLVKALIPLAILAVIIVVVLAVIDKVDG